MTRRMSGGFLIKRQRTPFFFSSSSNRFVSATTTPERNKRPIKFGMTVKPLNTSEIAQIKFKFVVIAPRLSTKI